MRIYLLLVVGLGLSVAVTRTVAAQVFPDIGKENRIVPCVRSVGDLNGDGISDFAVSVRSDRQAPVLIIFGTGDPHVADGDWQGLKKHATLVVRGPRAAPFRCSEAGNLMVSHVTAGAEKRKAPASVIVKPPSYTVVDLDPLMPGFTSGFSSTANAINANGQIVGRFLTAEFEHAFAYDNGTVRDLGTLGGHFSDARDINDASLVVGYSLTGEVDNSGFVSDAFLHDGSTMRDLGMRWSSAEAISNTGVIVGEMRVQPTVDLNHAFLFDQGFAADLGTLPPFGTSAHSVALAVNDSGKVVGESDTFVLGKLNPSVRYFARHAFAYDSGVMSDVGSLGPVCAPAADGGERCLDESTATDVNNLGEIVGFSTTPTGPHAFVKKGASLEDIGALGGGDSWAYSINDSGQIVGASVNAQQQYVPFLYDEGMVYELNSLIVNPSNSLPFAAYAINNFGQIVGNHHLLNPVYDVLAPGHKLSFEMSFDEALSFEYWLIRGDLRGCNATRNRLQFQIKFDLKIRPAAWVRIGEMAGCETSTDWTKISVNIPPELQHASARVHIRVREQGTPTAPLLYLRHVSATAAMDR